MPFEAYKIYQEYEKDKYKTSIQKKAEKALEEAEKEGIKPPEKESFDFDEAREIFGKDFLGPEAIKTTFDIELTQEELEEIEQIPYSKEELEKAKELGMMLVLRISRDKDNNPLTINKMREIFQTDTLGNPSKKKSKMFFRKTGEGWYDNESFATKDVAKLKWALVKKEVLPESLGKNWDQQEEILKKWAKENDIDLKTLKRRIPVEIAYDTLLYYGQNKESLLEKTYDWTGVQSSNGRFVIVGHFASVGLSVLNNSRGYSDSILGVCPAS